MVYKTETKSMLIGSIVGDNISILFNPKLQKLYTGDTIKITDEDNQGIIAQIYKIENFDLKDIPEEAFNSPQISNISSLITKSHGDLNYLHVANCKIKYSIISHKWVNWRGNLPSIIDLVELVTPTEIISHTVGSSPLNPISLGYFVSHELIPFNIEAGLLEKTSIIVGDKDKEKSNILNILANELIQKDAKVLIIDPKGSYNIPENSQMLEAGKSFKLSLMEYGVSILGNLIVSQTEPGIKLKVEGIYTNLVNYALSQVENFLPLSYLKEILDNELSTTEGQKVFLELSTLKNRIVAIDKLGIFANNKKECPDLTNILNEENYLVLDISSIPLFWQKVYVRKVIKDLAKSNICVFVFYEDVNRYLDNELALELIYKTKNLGINNIFMTTYEDEIPPDTIKQSDNLFLFSTDNLESNALFYNNLKSDKNLISMLLKRLPENTVLLHGEISNNYPIQLELQDSSLYSSKNVHFGSISKQVSEQGEIIYSYKSGDRPLPKPQKASFLQQNVDYPEWQPSSIKQKTPPQELESLEDYSLDNPDELNNIPQEQESFMDKYRTLSAEYEEEEYQEIEETAQEKPAAYDNEEQEEDFYQEELIYEDIEEEEEASIEIPEEESIQQYTQQAIPQQPLKQPHAQPIEATSIQTAKTTPTPGPQRQQIPIQQPDPDIMTEAIHADSQFPEVKPVPQPVQRQRDSDQNIRTQEKPAYQPSQAQPRTARPPQPRQDHIPEHLEDIPVYAAPSLDDDSAEFKEGDKVHHERYGTGVINRIIVTGDKQLCSIQFQDYGRRLLDPKRGLTKIE